MRRIRTVRRDREGRPIPRARVPVDTEPEPVPADSELERLKAIIQSKAASDGSPATLVDDNNRPLTRLQASKAAASTPSRTDSEELELDDERMAPDERRRLDWRRGTQVRRKAMPLKLRAELARFVLAPSEESSSRKQTLDIDAGALQKIERMPPQGSALEALAAEWDVSPTLPDWLTAPHPFFGPLRHLYDLCVGIARPSEGPHSTEELPAGTLNFEQLRNGMSDGETVTREDVLSLFAFYIDPAAVRYLVWGVPSYDTTHPVRPEDLARIAEAALPNVERFVFSEDHCEGVATDQMPGARFCALMPGLAAACPKLNDVVVGSLSPAVLGFGSGPQPQIEGVLAEAAATALGARLEAFTLLGQVEGTAYDDALRALARRCPNLRELTVRGARGGYEHCERGGITLPALLELAGRCPRLTRLDLQRTPGARLGDAYLAASLTDAALEELGRCLPNLRVLRLPLRPPSEAQPEAPRSGSDGGVSVRGLTALARGCPNLVKLEVVAEPEEGYDQALGEAKRAAARAVVARQRLRGVAGAAMGMRRAFSRAVERLFAPGGTGYEAARREFTDLATTRPGASTTIHAQ